MIKLKHVIHDLKTNSVEATWVDQTIAPDTLVPEVIEPDTTDEAGNIIPGLVTPGHTVAGEVTEITVKCHSYADVQMGMLRADIATLGGTLAEHSALIALVESNIKPPTPPTAEEVAAKQAQRIDALWRAADTYVAGYISGVAIGLLTIGMIQGLPKARGVVGWSSAIWAAYYTRKALVATTSVDDLDFSSFGPMPYSVPELRTELGM